MLDKILLNLPDFIVRELKWLGELSPFEFLVLVLVCFLGCWMVAKTTGFLK